MLLQSNKKSSMMAMSEAGTKAQNSEEDWQKEGRGKAKLFTFPKQVMGNTLFER